MRVIPSLPASSDAWDWHVLDEQQTELEALLSSDWGAPYTEGATTVWYRPPEENSPLARVRCRAVIAASANEVVEFVSDFNNYTKHKLDPCFVRGRVVEKAETADKGEMSVRVAEYNLGWPLWPREFLVVFRRQKLPNGELCVSNSIESHPLAPLRDTEVVRGSVKDYFRAVDVQGNVRKCIVDAITCADPGGYVPYAVTNYTMTSNAGVVAQVKSFFEKAQ